MTRRKTILNPLSKHSKSNIESMVASREGGRLLTVKPLMEAFVELQKMGYSPFADDTQSEEENELDVLIDGVPFTICKLGVSTHD